MTAIRGLLTLVRVVGVLALALVLYAWVYPEQLGKWIGAASSEPAVPVAAVAPAVPAASVPAQAALAATGPAAPPVAAPAPEPAKPAVPPPPPVPSVQLSKSQAAMAQWLGLKYRVSPAAIGALIAEADKLSKSYRLSPNLIIAVMAIESNFHPYIQSEAGAQGLMQVMPRIHAKRYQKYGGKSSFIDPIVSLKVGAEILRDCVKLKGSETEALRFYFGGGASSDAYIDKVRAEQRRLNQVAAGARVPVDAAP
ncbi:transglycosylase SLT domain-containing protein [Massilia sp. Dwa41.01b]|uniref:transglycosylase SLT domain-containing protein n=1 Tax=unclassified Massilia TaxID=2609279 RepID=UPI001602C9DA|nr:MULTISPECIES: transglycosylase SLT domain-containing protein [unclassified Massilia]QNA89972.1 transglycosylase SLT domain-containing protein [Massilia sp. Dwa41.01b]QNB00856.1 transglycosylase SLT domain-containing protein [Massilia sp. Se16.2.3]